MYLLAIETCSPQCSVAISNAEQVIYSEAVQHSKHAECILPMIQNACEQAGLTLDEITDIAVTHGPGSFTGVRTGLSVAQGLALSDDLPIHTTSSLALLAYQATQLSTQASLILTTLDARMREVYYGIWAHQANALTLLHPLGVIAPEKFPIPDDMENAFGVGTGWVPYWEQYPGIIREKLFLSPAPVLPSAQNLAEMVLHNHPLLETVTAPKLTACYVRDEVAIPARIPGAAQ